MRAMSHHGYMFKLDIVDAFLNMPLSEESVPLCAIEWEGQLYVYKSLGFGFKSWPPNRRKKQVLKSISGTHIRVI
jgi:hypothetical protein